MKTQRTITIDLEELKSFLKEKFGVQAPLYHIKIETVQEVESRKDAIRLTWEEGTGDQSWSR